MKTNMDTAYPVPPMHLLEYFQVSSPIPVENTSIASIWRVIQKSGEYAALKKYHDIKMGNERFGFVLLKEWSGRSAAKMLGETSGAVLIEWLEGPSLGDLVRDGEDEEASEILVEVANNLHQKKYTFSKKFPNLNDWYSALLNFNIPSFWPETFRKDMNQCKSLAIELLESQEDKVFLHGDLHQDNIRLGTRGYCAFDAKGIYGERAYELANAFRNPKGGEKIVRDPVRIARLANMFSNKFRVDESRLLKWASTKCALSIVWRSKTQDNIDPESDLLRLLLKAV